MEIYGRQFRFMEIKPGVPYNSDLNAKKNETLKLVKTGFLVGEEKNHETKLKAY